MKKILLAALAAMQLTTAVYAQNDAFAPEAKNDLVYTVLTEENVTMPTASPDLQNVEPTPAPTVIPKKTAEPLPEPVVQPVKYKADTFTVNFTVEGGGYSDRRNVKFALYDGAVLLDESSYYVTENTNSFSVTFNVPEYEVGKTFYVACSEGAWGIRYYDDFYSTGMGAPAPTYAYTDENGKDVIVTSAAMNIMTYKEKEVRIYVDGKQLSLKSQPRFIDGVVMVPVRETAEALGVFDVTYNAQYNSVRVAIGNKETLFNIGYPWTTVNGNNRVDKLPTMYIGQNVYVPVKTLSDGVESNAEIWEHDAYTDVILKRSQYVVNYIDKVNYVTKNGLTSKTDYLIWVSKANYEVNVFKNSGGVWNFITSFRCAIGTSATPTCVGTYRYYEKIPRWTYPDFYVGPVMRFNGGYAIHSTLLKYDGTDYNRAVGKKLSHGCVRVQPPDMDWLVNNIPMYTTVHVTDI